MFLLALSFLTACQNHTGTIPVEESHGWTVGDPEIIGDDTGEAECATLTWYLDYDQDGYGDDGTYGWPTVEACDQPDGYVANNTDCDDWHDAQNPGVTEYCNGADDDCDGIVPEDEIDADGDGFNQCTAAVDCDDTRATIHPGAEETCNSLDDDCDGLNDEGFEYYVGHFDADGDGYGDPNSTTASGCPGTEPDGYVDNGEDCDDTDSSIYPGHGC